MNEKRFAVIVLKEHNEIQIVDTTEDNVMLLSLNCEDNIALEYIKQDFQQIVNELNYLSEQLERTYEEISLLKKYIAIFQYDYRAKALKMPTLEVD